jgi:hypothetical protein
MTDVLHYQSLVQIASRVRQGYRISKLSDQVGEELVVPPGSFDFAAG